MQEEQSRVKNFVDTRKWERVSAVKDLMLNINEEVGEAWNLIKWVDSETQEKIIKEHHDEFEDFIGDVMYLAYRIANTSNVDAQKAITRTIEEYEQRFPAKEVEGRHANLNAGGIDKKYTNNN